MVVKLADRVSESAQATGTGSFTLGGPSETQYIAFSTAFTTGDLISYVAVQGEKWEIGTGTLLSETQLSRDFVWNTSDQTGINSQNIPGSSLTKISFDSGTTITIFVGLPSHLVLALDENGDLLDPSPFRNVVFIDTLTAMKALAGLSDGETVVVTEDEVGGIFKWDATDSTAADDIDTFRNDNSSGVGLHKRVSIRVQASFNGSMTVDAAAAGDSYIDLFTAKKASNATKYFRWFTDAANNAVRLASRLNQGSLTNFLSVYSAGDNADRVAFDKPSVLATRSDAQGIKNKTLAWLSGVSRLVMATADAANNTTEAAYKEIPLTKGGFIVSDVIDVYALKQIDPVVAGFTDGDRAIARGSNTVSGSSSSGNSGNTKALIYYWASTSTASADDIKVVRPSVGAAATGNGRWLLLVSDITKTMTSGDATPTVKGCEWLITAGTTAVTNFTDGYEGQVITIERASADIVITHDPTKINIGGQNRTLTATSPRASFRLIGSVWKCIDAGDISDRIQNTLTAGVTTIGAAQDIVLSSIKATGAGNLCYNSSFEYGSGTVADGWSLSSSGGVTATASIVTSTLNVTGRAQQVVLSGLSSSLVNDIRTAANAQNFMALEKPQGTFTASAMLYAPVGLNARIILQFGTVSGNTFTTVTTITGTLTAATGAWQQITATGTAGATATHAIMFLRTVGGSLTSGTVLWDNAQLEQGSIATTWRQSASDVVASQKTALYLLDFCTSETQRAGILAGTNGIDEIWSTAAAAALAQGRPLRMGYSPNYKAFNALTNPGIKVYGEGCTITRSGIGFLFDTSGTSPAMSGNLLTANATAGSTTITVSTGTAASLVVGQNYVLTDRTTLISTSVQGEFVQIQAINTGTGVVTLWWPIIYSYLTSASARIVLAPFIDNVEYRDLNIKMDLTVDVVTNPNNRVFNNAWLRAPRFHNIRIDNYLNSAFQNLCCMDANFSNIFFNYGGSGSDVDGSSTQGRPGAAYGIVEQGLNRGLIATNIHAYGIRHLYTTGATPNNSGVPADYGEPVGSLINGFSHIGALNAGIDTHEAGRYIKLMNGVIRDGQHVGVQCRSKYMTVENVTVTNMIGCALWDRGGNSGNSYADGTIVRNLTASFTNMGTDFDGNDWTLWGAVMAEAHRCYMDGLHIDNCGGAPLMIGRNSGFQNQQFKNIHVIDPCKLTTGAASTKAIINLVNCSTTGALIIDGVRVRDSNAKAADVLYIGSSVTTASVYYSDFNSVGHTGALVNNVGATANLFPNVVTTFRIQREGATAQYIETVPDSGGNTVKSYSPPASAKGYAVDVTTDTSNSSVSGGSLSFAVRMRGTTRFNVIESGQVQLQGVTTITADRAYVPPSYTAANIGSKTHAVNTTDKLAGKTVYDSTNARLLMATGSSDVSTWVLVSGGATVITPS